MSLEDMDFGDLEAAVVQDWMVDRGFVPDGGKEISVTKSTALGFTEEMGQVPTLTDWLESLAEPDVGFKGTKCFLAEKLFDEHYAHLGVCTDESGNSYVEEGWGRIYRMPTQPVHDPGVWEIKPMKAQADDREHIKPIPQRPNFKKLGRRNWKAKRGRR